MRHIHAALVAIAVVIGLGAPVAHAQAPAPTALKPLHILAFDGGWNLPMWVAERNGLFEAQGLDVDLKYTPTSGYLVVSVLTGKADIAFAAIDNVIAYQEGQGEAKIPEQPDLFAFMGGDGGFISIVAAPGVTSVADLKGKTVSVDAMTTGFAFVVRELVARNGLAEADVNFVRAGGTANRYRDLVAGKHDATLLRTPFELLAESRGYHRIASAETLGAYQGTVGLARRSWARDHEAMLVGFLRAYKAATDWLYDPANREIAEALLVAQHPRHDACAREALVRPAGRGQGRTVARPRARPGRNPHRARNCAASTRRRKRRSTTRSSTSISRITRRRSASRSRAWRSASDREPTIVRPDDIDPHHRWDRPLQAPGHTQVDFEERVDFRRLHDYRLARTRAALAQSGLGALLCFDQHNIRYTTSTVIGEWARDKLTRYSLLTGNGDPYIWDFGSAAKHHRLHAPWLHHDHCRAGLLGLARRDRRRHHAVSRRGAGDQGDPRRGRRRRTCRSASTWSSRRCCSSCRSSASRCATASRRCCRRARSRTSTS